MSEFVGTVIAAAQLGLDAILIKPHRGIGPFVAHVTISEDHTDELEVTDQPVDQGASISDHAYMRPAQLVLQAAWSDSLAAANAFQAVQNIIPGTQAGLAAITSGNAPSQIRDTYAKLLQLQASRTPFSVFTGKRNYDNMVMTSLVVKTDRESENILHITARLRQVLLAQVVVRTISADASAQRDPAATQPVANKGLKQLTSAPAINVNAALKAGLVAVSARAQVAINTAVSSKITGLLGG